jgi:membrane protein YqaA with SNARE-associated domain
MNHELIFILVAVAFAASTLFLVPAEFIKTRMQTSHFKSVWDCIKDSTSPSQGGFWGLYSGYSAILVRDLPYFALQLGCYDNIKNILNGKVASSFVKSIGFNLEPNGIELFSSIAAGFIVSNFLFINYL